MNFDDLVSLAEKVIQQTRAALPPEIAVQVAPVPVFVEPLPSADDVASGIAPDTLGLFDPGSDGHAPLPCIRLWLTNIWDFSEENSEVFCEEVRTTLLHEIGHLLGWDEEDLEIRGLD